VPFGLDNDNHTSTENQFCTFLKPELAALPSEGFARAVDLVAGKLDRFGVSVGGCVVLPGHVLDAEGMIQAHYGVIDDVSRKGEPVLSAEAVTALAQMRDGRDVPALGAFQFLEDFDFFSATALAVLYDNLKSVRLAGGTHGAFVNVRGNEYIIFNGFHPDQILRFTRAESAIVVMECYSETHWSELRQEMTGVTNPASAAEGSIRRELLERQRELGIAEFNAGQNGVHVSAGPIEGAVELVRYFKATSRELTLDQTHLGRALAALGVGPGLRDELERNAVVDLAGKQGPAFDLTEEIDMKTLIDELTAAST
jgi:hypothetical protein